MTLQATSPRPQSMSAGAAILRVVVTLLMFLVVFIAFLIAPLLALGVGYLAYLVWRSRGAKPAAGSPGARQQKSVSGFGAGAQ
jgi:threonine/homoserine/homoserine lactone efflux protein